jgi:hypothetical protein
MATPTQDRLIRKEVALATIRAIEPPQGHIGLSIVPFRDVATDDVIFDYAKPTVTGLAPARAEDAESELAQKDTIFGGTGRAAVLDWAQKDHYTASDVSRYREAALIDARLGGVNGLRLPLVVGSQLEDMRRKFATDDVARRRRLDNRIEWLIMTALSTGGITYNDNKIRFTVDFGRPAGQHDQVPAGGLWTLGTSDPIGDVKAVVQYMDDTYGIKVSRAVTSQKVINSMINSDRFIARTGLVVGGTPVSSPIDLDYVLPGWDNEAARRVVETATGVSFQPYDSVYRTRPIGGTTTTNNRFFPQNKILFLPDEAQIADLEDGDGLGFGKTLTSPHPEGNWQPGFYEWERETEDPWGTDRGTGIKAFPVFPYMQYTFTMVPIP